MGQVLTVGLETGKTAISWDAQAAFFDIDYVGIADLAWYGDELLVATRFGDGEDGALCAIDLDSGARRILPGLGGLRELVVSSGDGLAFVADANCAIVAIDLATGKRAPRSNIGVPPGCQNSDVVAYDGVHDRLVVKFGHDVEGGFRTDPYVIDLTTGDTTLVPVDGSVPAYTWQGMTVDPHGQSLIVVDAELEALVAIDLVLGQMIILAR
jgi:hypothetical protein